MSSSNDARMQALQEKVREVKVPLKGEHGDGEDTEVGNYFVANYPPFSFWSPDQAQKVHDVLETPAPTDTNLGLYFHIPFCRKRCHFCYFRVYTDKNAGEIKAYLDAAIRELEMYADKPYIKGRTPQFIYFGGGTPSYLSVNQLEDLTSRMKDLLPWDGVEEVAFECEPGTLTEKKLEKIREIGVTRLSLGIENFDDHILELNGRAHRSQELHRAIKFAKALDFPQLNIDLIAGMMDETEDNWKRCVEQAIAYDPECVTIYQMEIPFNTEIYKSMQANSKEVAPVANWETKRRWVDYAFDEFVKAGYTVSSAYTVVKDPDKTKFLYRDSLWEGADLLAMGVASFGHLKGIHYQNQHDVGPYMMGVDEGKLPIYRAYETDAEERLVREFVLQLKLGRTRISYYQEKYGVDVTERFAGHLAVIAEMGFLKVEKENDAIVLNREGMLQIDRLLHGFFLPQHRDARYA